MRLKLVTTMPTVRLMSGEDLSKLLMTPGGGSAQGISHGSAFGGSCDILEVHCYRR